jgi:hypothetical protein
MDTTIIKENAKLAAITEITYSFCYNQLITNAITPTELLEQPTMLNLTDNEEYNKRLIKAELKGKQKAIKKYNSN